MSDDQSLLFRDPSNRTKRPTLMKVGYEDDLMPPQRLTAEHKAGFRAATDIPADIQEADMDQAAVLCSGSSLMKGMSLASSPHVVRGGTQYREVRS